MRAAAARLAAVLAEVRGPILLVVAGSNGAGKSTFHRRYLAGLGWPFVNADEIAKARGGPVDEAAAVEAADLARRLRGDLVGRGVSFAMETVFSDPVGARLDEFAQARSRGYTVVMIFIGLGSAEVSAARVLQRVRDESGHDVPDERLRARYPRTLANLARALRALDHVFVLDNDSPRSPWREVAVWRGGEPAWEAATLPPWYLGARAAARRR